jgi:hypothetical protein
MFHVLSRFMKRLLGVTKGWPATDAGTGIHMDLPDGYISIDSVAGQKRVITHFAVAVDHIDRVAAKHLADKINSELPDAKARDAYHANTGGSTANLREPDGFFVQISSTDQYAFARSSIISTGTDSKSHQTPPSTPISI